MTTPHDDRGAEQPPPILGSWSTFYGVVIAVLVVEIVIFSLLTRWLS